MPNWKLRAAVQGGIALLPYRQTWNRLLQKYVTKTLDLNTETFEYKLTIVNEHVSNYLETASSPKNSFSVLELGTGWHPVIPVELLVPQCVLRPFWDMPMSEKTVEIVLCCG